MSKTRTSKLLFAAIILSFLIYPAVALASQPISVIVNGRALIMDTPPVIRDNRTLVPLRAIFEAIGADVEWNTATNTITGKSTETTVVLQIGNRTARVNNDAVTLDVPPAVIGGRTMVPTRFIAESLGADVNWDSKTRTVIVKTGGAAVIAVNTISATVTGITDGDTIRVSFENKKEETVRLIGVDTPESTREIEPFGKDAAAFTKKSLAGKTVFLELDVSERDRFGRLLAYVWLAQPRDDNEAEVRRKMFNAELLLQGYAQIMTIAPNIKYADMFLKFEREARNAGKGLWPAAGPPGEPVSGVVIASVDLVAEVVTIENLSSGSIDISGWVLISENGNQRFTFPQGSVIPAASGITVVSGPNAAPAAGRLLWTRSHIWSNDGDPAVLLDRNNREVSRR